MQCPYSKTNWQNLAAIKAEFGNDYDFEVCLTSLAFHPQAFTAQCGASLVESRKGRDALLKYVDACFEHQETYMNAALGDARKSDVDAVFATIAEKAGVLDDAFTKEAFLADLHDWESAVKPAYTEHKVALGHGVTCRCRNQRRVDGVDAVDRTHRFMARRSTSSTASSFRTRSPRGARRNGRRS